MNLTKEVKAKIDAMSPDQLLSGWRFTDAGNPWFEGESGEYWLKKLNDYRRDYPDLWPALSKRIGWTP